MMTPPSGYTSSNLVFNDSFAGNALSPSWNPWMADAGGGGSMSGAWFANGSGGSAVGTNSGNFLADYDLPSHVAVNNGLTLTATRQSQAVGGETWPWTSGVVSTEGHVAFTGGYVQVSMKQAAGNGAWPAIWLLPSDSKVGAT